MRDVAIVGGGVIGLSAALELARRGLSVEVYDGNAKGQASWAAAGILAPQSEVHEASPMLELCRRSFALYPQFVQNFGEVGFCQNGTLHRAFSEAEATGLRAKAAWQKAAGLRVDERPDGTFFFPDEGQVDNRKLMLALRAACVAQGVQMVSHSLLKPAMVKERERPVVVCTGAWSWFFAGFKVFPVKGEMLALAAKPPAQVIFGGGGYLVPRGDLTLVGATAKPGDFDPSPTAEARQFLLEVASRHGYGGAEVVDHWAGLRPGTPDGLPLLGKAGNLIVATGHFRNGILLAPVTAQIVAALVQGQTPPVDLAPFDPLRYSSVPA
jgi:glycine oxidase